MAAARPPVPYSLRPERARHVGVSIYRSGIVRTRGCKLISNPAPASTKSLFSVMGRWPPLYRRNSHSKEDYRGPVMNSVCMRLSDAYKSD